MVYRSCGHVCEPQSLTKWCRKLLRNGAIQFTCPVLDENKVACGKVWPFYEVCRMAVLDNNETSSFLQQLETNRVNMGGGEFKHCPQCRSFIDYNKDTLPCPLGFKQPLKIECRMCKEYFKNSEFTFCWQCNNPWPNETRDKAASAHDAVKKGMCGRSDCRNEKLTKLKRCLHIKYELIKNTNRFFTKFGKFWKSHIFGHFFIQR